MSLLALSQRQTQLQLTAPLLNQLTSPIAIAHRPLSLHLQSTLPLLMLHHLNHLSTPTLVIPLASEGELGALTTRGEECCNGSFMRRSHSLAQVIACHHQAMVTLLRMLRTLTPLMLPLPSIPPLACPTHIPDLLPVWLEVLLPLDRPSLLTLHHMLNRHVLRLVTQLSPLYPIAIPKGQSQPLPINHQHLMTRIVRTYSVSSL